MTTIENDSFFVLNFNVKMKEKVKFYDLYL